MATINLEEKFEKIIMEQLENIKKGVPLKQCPDNHVGYLEILENYVSEHKLWFSSKERIRNHHIVSESIKPKSMKNPCKTIVIILESPHKDEYNKVKYKIAPAPALGATGRNLDEDFVNKFNDFLLDNEGIVEDGAYQVILMNAIQFQCSLGLEPIATKIRDDNFLSLWADDNIVKNFEKRLKNYEPVILINCSTNGDITKGMVNRIFEKPKSDWAFSKYKQKYLDITKRNKYFIYGFIQNSIDELFTKDGVEKLRCTHPSSWKRRKEYVIIKRY